MQVKILTLGFLGWLLLGQASAPASTSVSSRRAAPLSVLTFNLHGYHPTGERERIFEDRDGRETRAPSDIYYFSWNEIVRGHAKRLDALSGRIRELEPDIVFLQEVGAGSPETRLDCSDFTKTFQTDRAEENTALRLKRRLGSRGASYQPLLACRGNTGWITTGETFSTRRIVAAGTRSARQQQNSAKEVIFDFGSNPYPRGMLIEGNAMLVASSVRVLWHSGIHVPIAGGREDHFFQAAVLESARGGGRILAVNVHMGHKLRNFEHAIAIQHWIQEAREKFKVTHVLIGGDFNEVAGARESGTPEATLTMMPWEVISKGRFDFRLPEEPQKRAALIDDVKSRLSRINFLQGYKKFATISNPAEVRARIGLAIDAWMPLWQQAREAVSVFNESKSAARRCSAGTSWKSVCDFSARIDYWFASPSMSTEEFGIFESDADAYRTGGLSDHPAVFTRYELN